MPLENHAALRRRATKAIFPKRANISAQVSGSGTGLVMTTTLSTTPPTPLTLKGLALVSENCRRDSALPAVEVNEKLDTN